ncbi:uncharacterized protein LOC135828184 [Sycon ciliatum]|uniref:uncharacterized protein LOC135828184 n=1 Tax=Sycon ciliatum TaxID=27933 RepID=UPI0020AC4413|eukprot:scpid90078/ scgid6664/ 39S ribosomal protein L47, mitochondrial
MLRSLVSSAHLVQQASRLSAAKWKLGSNCAAVECAARYVSTSVPRLGLEEFFPDLSQHPNERNRSGRAWDVTDLRLKSDTDLHKLWYVLLKERNMLDTLKWSARRLRVEMPGQERFWKIEESMDNLRKVLLERDEAFRLADEEIRRLGEETTDLTAPKIETIEADSMEGEPEEKDAAEEAADANKRARKSVTVEPQDNEEHIDEPWMKQWDLRSFNSEEIHEYLVKEKVERKVHLMRKEYQKGSIRALKNHRRKRGQFINRRYPQQMNAKSPWIRPSSKFLRYKRRRVMKRFFVKGKMFSIR